MASCVYNPFYTNSSALVIGINDYKHVNKLEIACADAQAVATLLVSELGFPSGNVTLLLDEQATRAAIMRRFLSFESTAPDERLLIFFAGHGETVSGQRGEIGYLLPVDGRLEDKSTLIRWDELTRNAEVIPAKHILFIMDACYSGLAIQRGGRTGGQRFVSDMLQRFSRQVITAGKADEPVADGGSTSGKNSIFTGHLLEGLKGQAADENGVLTANGLMNYVYHKVATDPQSQQTPHYGHVYGDGDLIFRTPDNGHLSSDAGEDFLVQLLPERPDSVPLAILPEVRPVFAAKNGYADPESETFGQNEWSKRLGRIAYRAGTKSEVVSAQHWLALVAEPVSNEPIDFDIRHLATTLPNQVSQTDKMFDQFRMPSQSLTTATSAILYDGEWSNDGERAERWKRFFRIDRRGAIEHCEFGAAAAIYFAGRTNDNPGTPVRVFLYVQIIGLLWRFLFTVKRTLRLAGYEAGVRVLVNLIGARDSLLVNFSRETGVDNQRWREPFDMDALCGNSLQDWKCRDAHFQAEFLCSLASLGAAESKKLIVKCAHQLGLAYNHKSLPRCFNFGTEVFPWRQFNPNAGQ